MGLNPRRGGGRTGRSTVLTVALAVLIAGPLVGLPISFIVAPDHFGKFSNFLPEAFAATGILIVGVGTGTLLLGTSLAALVSFCDFPGRSWIEWILVLPLAMPGYVFTLFALGLDVPNIRSAGGAVVIFTLVLYPYVYLLARSAFLAQSRTLMEAARGLGLSRGAAIVRVGLPLARPAILAGVALALMETLADFGTVNLLGVRTFTDAIYRVWFNAFDREAAMQFATILMSVTLVLLLLERLARGRARYHYDASRGDVIPPIRLRGPAAAAAVIVPLAAGGGGAGRAAGSAVGMGRAVDPGRSSGPRVRDPDAQQPAAVRDERGAGSADGAGAGVRRPVQPVPNGRRGGPAGYDRLRPAGLGGGGGRDRAARVARPPARRRRRVPVRSGSRIDLHRNRDRIVLRLPRAVPRAGLGRGGVQPGQDPGAAGRGGPRARRRSAST